MAAGCTVLPTTVIAGQTRTGCRAFAGLKKLEVLADTRLASVPLLAPILATRGGVVAPWVRCSGDAAVAKRSGETPCGVDFAAVGPTPKQGVGLMGIDGAGSEGV